MGQEPGAPARIRHNRHVRFVACLAAMVGGVALAACGGGDATPKRAAEPTTSTQAPPMPTGTTPAPAGTTPAPRSQTTPIPPPERARRADPAATRVIRAWSDALRGGDVEAAARYFALPSVVENGPPPLRVRTRDDARAFNASLPCGAVLRRAVAIGRYTAVVFRLTERPGGDCGQGVGHPAGTAFVIRHGKILEWRRVDEKTIPPEGVVGPTGRHPPEAPILPPGKRPRPQPQVPTATGPVI
jgi:hypothetical protein